MGSIEFFPLRHQSVAAAVALQSCIEESRPSVILLEGPYDFNTKLDELYLPHELPIAIYSFVREQSEFFQGVYYPLCDYSPEWIALQCARRLAIPVRFIDLPGAGINGKNLLPEYMGASIDQAIEGDLISGLCKKFGVSNFDDLWEELFEVAGSRQVDSYREAALFFCTKMREVMNEIDPEILAREAFMAGKIRAARAEFNGSILVAVGGIHCNALRARIEKQPEMDELNWGSNEEFESGIALTPYSQERLGGNAPGFYDSVWKNLKNERFNHRPLLRKIIKSLRDKGQPVGTANRIAVETMSRALADLRGHHDIWRRDLIDGLKSVLVKDEIIKEAEHPLLQVLSECMKGTGVGRLAAGTSVPPIVPDIYSELKRIDLVPGAAVKTISLDLSDALQREKSVVLHRLRLLKIEGIIQTVALDVFSRKDLSDATEEWEIVQHSDMHSSCIEAARYGGTLMEAAAGALSERLRLENNFESAARCILEAALAGLGTHSHRLTSVLMNLVAAQQDFIQLCKALDHIVYLYAYDQILHWTEKDALGQLVRETYLRSLDLLDCFGGNDAGAEGVKSILQTYQYCAETLSLSLDLLAEVFARVVADSKMDPFTRGAVCGAQWKLNLHNSIADQLNSFYEPSQIGDFLYGVFTTARETVQRDKKLLSFLNEKVLQYSYVEFLEALPALKMAFSYFTPREKHNLSQQIYRVIVPAVETMEREGPKAVLRATELERRLLHVISQYGIRGIKNS